MSDYAAFNERYNAVAKDIPVAGIFSGQLGSTSGTVNLYQAGTANLTTGYIPYYEIDPVDYSNAAPWPTQAGGNGSALIRVHPADFGSEPLSWQASNAGGTPGGANLPLVTFTPSTPTNLTAQAALNPNEVTLDWVASTAPQSNVAQYIIYRNGTSIGISTTTSYVDTTLVPGTNYFYTISAVNRDGYASPQSTPVAIDLPGVSAYDWPTSQQMSIEFNEPLNATTASAVSAYALSGGITIGSVALLRDNTEVTLTTNQAFTSGSAYTLTMTGLTTASGRPLPASLPLAFIYGTTVGQMTDSITPPVPQDLRATLTGTTQVNLSWQPAIDLTSGVAYYAIYRDGSLYSTTTNNSFTDSSDISSQTPHYYQVAVVNWDGLQGALSPTLRVVPPGIAAVTVLGPTTVEVQFTEPVTGASAQAISNYQIQGVTISSAVRQSDGASVVLTTSTLGSNGFTLTASNIVTLAGVALSELTSTAAGTTTGWTVQYYQSTAAFESSNGTIANLAEAQTLANTPADQLSAQTLTPQVINYGAGQSGAGSGNFTPDILLPGQTSASEEIDDYVLVANGSVYIPSAGDYTFDGNTDDGFQLTITGANFVSATNATDYNGDTMEYDEGRGATDTLGVAAFPAAGYYPINLLYFQGTGPSGSEISAASGAYTSFVSGAVPIGRQYGGRRPCDGRHLRGAPVQRRRQ